MGKDIDEYMGWVCMYEKCQDKKKSNLEKKRICGKTLKLTCVWMDEYIQIK